MTTGALLMAIFMMLVEDPGLQGQVAKRCAESIIYENRNQVDPPPLLISDLSGRAITEIGDPASKGGPVAGLCIGLFTDRGHRLVSTVVSNEEGMFYFARPAPGHYRLVARAEGLCTLNVPLRVVRLKGKVASRRRVVFHMRPPSIDSCSYADFK